MKTDTHFVSLIIPTIGRRSLSLTRESLKIQTRPPDEVIIEFDDFRRGPAWTRNQGFKKARGDLIAFTDDDCFAGKNWLEKMVSAIDMYDADMVFSHYIETDPLLREAWMRRRLPLTARMNPNEFVANTGNVIYRRQCLEKCQETEGLIFNPVFGSYAAEDTDLSFRLRQRGYKLVYIDNPLKHFKKLTLLNYLLFQFNRGVGIGILYNQHRKKNQDDTPDKSLLWETQKAHSPVFKWLVMIWKKVLGPFDRNSFSSIKYFWAFWLGEKSQAIGFLYAMLFKR